MDYPNELARPQPGIAAESPPWAGAEGRRARGLAANSPARGTRGLPKANDFNAALQTERARGELFFYGRIFEGFLK